MNRRFFLTAFYGAVALFGVLLVAVFLTGSTFGQRCAKLWPVDSPAWESCVERFAAGRPRDTQ